MLAGRSSHALVRRGASANAAAAGKFVWNASKHATAKNLSTTAKTDMMTGNKFMCAQLPVHTTKDFV